MALLGKLCHWGGGLRGLIDAQAMSSGSDHLLLPVNQLLFQHHICLHAAMSHHEDTANGSHPN